MFLLNSFFLWNGLHTELEPLESEKSSFTSLYTEGVSGTRRIHVFGHLLQQ